VGAHSLAVRVSDGAYEYRPQEQMLLYAHGRLDTPNGVHWVRLERTAAL
jgi:hypothetical protein